MPWVRIDEKAMEHPKVAGLPDGVFRLWVTGLAYCQKFLTDGYVSDAALRGLRGHSANRKNELIQSGLWESAEGGIQVHDFLDWNESRDKVLAARQSARERLQRHRKRVSTTESNAHGPVRTVGGSSQALELARSEGGAGETKPPGRLSFGGKVLEVPKFLDEEFVKRLNGQYFDLTGFYDALDQRLAQTGEPWDLRWIREQFAAASPSPERRRIERAEEERPFTHAERTKAERLRRSTWGGCRHEPRCETSAGCIAAIIRSWRAEEIPA